MGGWRRQGRQPVYAIRSPAARSGIAHAPHVGIAPVQRSLSRQASGDCFIDLPAGQIQHSFIDGWLPDADADADAGAEAWQISLTPPRPAPRCPAPRRRWRWSAQASLVFVRQAGQGLNGTMALLALAPTERPKPLAGAAPRNAATAGVRQVQLRCTADTPAEVMPGSSATICWWGSASHNPPVSNWMPGSRARRHTSTTA